MVDVPTKTLGLSEASFSCVASMAFCHLLSAPWCLLALVSLVAYGSKVRHAEAAHQEGMVHATLRNFPCPFDATKKVRKLGFVLSWYPMHHVLLLLMEGVKW